MHLMLLLSQLVLSSAMAHTVESVPTPDVNSIDWIESHGPEKPPPDDGYEFKGAKGGNALGKIGLLSFAGGMVTTVIYLRTDDETKKKNMGYTSLGLMGTGVVLLWIERSS